MMDLPAVGETYVRQLKKHGLTKPSQVMGKFLQLGRTEFEIFLKKDIGMRQVGKNDNIFELASAFEAKWNNLALQ